MKVKDLLKAKSHLLITIGPQQTVYAVIKMLVEIIWGRCRYAMPRARCRASSPRGTAIKLLYEVEVSEKKLQVCKQCKSALAHGKKKEEVAAIG